MTDYQPTDRRPLASRKIPCWQKTAAFLAARRVSPNAISVAGMVVGIAAGLCLAFTALSGPWWRLCFLAAAAGIQLRLLANMLDGMVAVASNRASAMGELYNEIPDRVSDAAILIGAGYAAGGDVVLGFTATCLAIMTAYIRAVGKSCGAKDLFVGPMAKPHRMFTVTVACLYIAATPVAWQPTWEGRGVMAGALLLIAAGACVACVRRLGRISRHLRGRA